MVFVPWGLYETVGEWNFRPIPSDPTRIPRQALVHVSLLHGAGQLLPFPTCPLKGVNITLKDYESGPLENWTKGALHFNGRDQYAV